MSTHAMNAVWTVQVVGRQDGLYVFTAEAHADRFATAVRSCGSICAVCEEPLNGAEMTDALIAAEIEEER